METGIVKKTNMLVALLLFICVSFTHRVHSTCNPCAHGKALKLCVPCPHPDGSLDITFGDHGRVITPIEGGDASARSVVTLPCGTIIAVGFSNTSVSGNRDFTLAAYTSYGVLDQEFGKNGIVLTNIACVLFDNGQHDLFVPSTDQAMAAVIQKPCSDCTMLCDDLCSESCIHYSSDRSKIVVVGSSTATPSGHTAFALARYNSNGSLDTSFGTGGVVVTPIGSIYAAATSVAIQRDNKIVVAGYTVTAGGIDFAVARYNCDGSLDQTFGCNRTGIVTIDFGGNDLAQAVKIQKNGKIVVAGYSDANGPNNDFALVRLTRGGKLDKTFGPDHTGKVLTDFSDHGTSNDTAHALVLVERCVSCCDSSAYVLKIIAVGSSNNAFDTNSDFALAAYNENGSLDKEFGPDRTGLVRTNIAKDMLSNDQAFAATLERSAGNHKCNRVCKIVVAGVSSPLGDDNDTDAGSIAVARYSLTGDLDQRFGSDGKVITHFGDDASVATAVTIAPDGDIIIAGRVFAGYTSDFALVRYTVCVPCC